MNRKLWKKAFKIKIFCDIKYVFSVILTIWMHPYWITVSIYIKKNNKKNSLTPNFWTSFLVLMGCQKNIQYTDSIQYKISMYKTLIKQQYWQKKYWPLWIYFWSLLLGDYMNI